MAGEEGTDRLVDAGAVALAAQPQLQQPEVAIGSERVIADRGSGLGQAGDVAVGHGVTRREHGGIAADGFAALCRLRRRAGHDRHGQQRNDDVYDAMCPGQRHVGRLAQGPAK